MGAAAERHYGNLKLSKTKGKQKEEDGEGIYKDEDSLLRASD
jgi:hypothetical protein